MSWFNKYRSIFFSLAILLPLSIFLGCIFKIQCTAKICCRRLFWLYCKLKPSHQNQTNISNVRISSIRIIIFQEKKLGLKTLLLCVLKFLTLPEVKQFLFMESVLNHKLFQNFQIFRLVFIESSVKIRVFFHFLWCKTCNKLKVL